MQLFDLAFSDSERAELTKLITLANFKLQAGQIGDCERILGGYWPQYLVENVPLTQTPATVAQRNGTPGTKSAASKPATGEEKQGILDQMKGFVPKLRR